MSRAPREIETAESVDTTVDGLTEDTLNTASVTCEIVGAGGKTVTREAEDLCLYQDCDLTIDKQVSCDGGATWGTTGTNVVDDGDDQRLRGDLV